MAKTVATCWSLLTRENKGHWAEGLAGSGPWRIVSESCRNSRSRWMVRGCTFSATGAVQRQRIEATSDAGRLQACIEQVMELRALDELHLWPEMSLLKIVTPEFFWSLLLVTLFCGTENSPSPATGSPSTSSMASWSPTAGTERIPRNQESDCWEPGWPTPLLPCS